MICPTPEAFAQYDLALLSPSRQAMMARHLESCAACRQEQERLRRVGPALAAMPTPMPPDDLWQRTAARLPDATPRAGRSVVRRWATGMGLVASMVLGGVLAGRQHLSSLPPAPTTAHNYLTTHQLLANQELLADRAGMASMLVATAGRE